MARFRPVDPTVDFPALERRVLDGWRDARIFEKSLKLREGSPGWVFYEGPPTANGKPGIHHVEARTFKDVYPRYRTMTGYLVERRAGWDCHGLPVELEVEKEIGTKTKRDIEAFGIAEFNQRCRESVTRYVDDWSRVTERIGFWLDLTNAYWTMDARYVESVWWSLKRLHEMGLLFEAHRSVAYCPRCGTALSDHEVAQGYRQVVDPSVFVRFPVIEATDPAAAGAALVGWTTTPWTLTSNLGLAVAPDETYARVRVGTEELIVADGLAERSFGPDADVVARFPGRALVGARYAPPYENVDGDTHRVVAADFVSMNEGTGVVHIAPGFGADDLALGRREGWPVFRPVDDAGRFTDDAPEFVRGRFVKEADPDIIADLASRGLLLSSGDYEHTYPMCWRCDTPLLYMARTSWYVRTTARKERLLEVNESVNWVPDHIKHGRYGDWLENNVDWALSRSRYWGTPLPVWRCENGHVTVVGSLAELSDLAGRDVRDLDPHRPGVDEVDLACPECGSTARRVPEVIDTWYDSGAMPFAQWAYHPELGRGLDEFARRFPADFIAEGLDQTRGWFYSLMAEAVLLFDSTAYRTVVCHGLVVDRDGRKMSKSLGNAVDPFDILDRYGADAVRWYFVAGGSPWVDRRFSPEVVEEVVRQFLLTLWNVYAFFVTYANADAFDPSAPPVPVPERPALDRWVLAELADTVSQVRAGMDRYDATGAGRRIERFVNDLSNWYVRRSRRRFWDPAEEGGASPEKSAAYQTLHECLTTLARLLAPFTPFVVEELWGNLVVAAGPTGEAAPESVHLADYPSPTPDRLDQALREAMAGVRSIVTLGRTVRTDARVRTRQPLSRAVVHYPGDQSALAPLLELVADELNVKEVAFAESAEQLAGWRARPNYRILGPRLGQRVKRVAEALGRDDGTLAEKLARGEPVFVAVDSGDEVSLGPDDVELTQQTEEGWGVAADGGLTVALDLVSTPALRREGVAREVIRLVQDARKAAGLSVSDRIELSLATSGDVADAVAEYRDKIAGETLAVSITDGPLPDPLLVTEARLDETSIAVGLRPASR